MSWGDPMQLQSTVNATQLAIPFAAGYHYGERLPLQSTTLYQPGLPVNGLGACGCTGIQSVNGIGASPDGLGDGTMLNSATGYWMADAAIGGAAGYFLATSEKDRVAFAIGGALAAAALGTIGLIATVGYGLYQRVAA